ncbi:MAG: hypothetical protein AB1668_06310 [Nanoarchaeota archaeon]
MIGKSKNYRVWLNTYILQKYLYNLKQWFKFMTEIPLREITLRYNGLFDLDGLYAAVVDWAKNYGYMWHETKYKHKVPSPAGAEQELTWLMTKNVTEYRREEIVFDLHIWDMLEVEVEANGRKKSLSNARIQILIKGKLGLDWQKRFTGKFAEKLGRLYEKVIQKDIESVYYDQLYYRIWNLHAVVKKYFDMQAEKFAYKGYLKEN